MMQQALAHYPFAGLACVGLGLFIAIFVAAVIWVHRPGSHALYQSLKNAPLRENTHE